MRYSGGSSPRASSSRSRSQATMARCSGSPSSVVASRCSHSPSSGTVAGRLPAARMRLRQVLVVTWRSQGQMARPRSKWRIACRTRMNTSWAASRASSRSRRKV